MKHTTGFYPRVQVDTTPSAAVAQAGGVTLTETLALTGLGAELGAGLGPWRKPLAVHDPAKVVLDLAPSLALGGKCLADVAVLRAEPGPVRAGGLRCHDLADDRCTGRGRANGVEAIDRARGAARARAWALAGEHAPDHGADASTQ